MGGVQFLDGWSEAGALCSASLDMRFHLSLLDAQGRSGILKRLILGLKAREQTRTSRQTEDE